MALGRRTACLVVLALAASGCVTGHLLQAGHRREQVLAYREACTEGDRLVVRYTALVTTEFGEVVGREERGAAIALRDLGPAGDGVPVQWSSLPESAARCAPARQLLITEDGDQRAGGTALLVQSAGGRHAGFVLHDPEAATAYVPFYSGSLTRTRTTPWVYALVPFSAAVDLASTPVLAVLGVPIVVFGD